jgi:short-subunit dehydrogenase involved in D-alanine esterification of teichoic acids
MIVVERVVDQCRRGRHRKSARAVAATGATVCVCDIDAKPLDTAAKDIPGLRTIVCDVCIRKLLRAVFFF